MLALITTTCTVLYSMYAVTCMSLRLPYYYTHCFITIITPYYNYYSLKPNCISASFSRFSLCKNLQIYNSGWVTRQLLYSYHHHHNIILTTLFQVVTSLGLYLAVLYYSVTFTAITLLYSYYNYSYNIYRLCAVCDYSIL